MITSPSSILLGKGRAPIPMSTWDSIIECAEWELGKAKAAGDRKRIGALRRSIRIAREKLAAGVAFVNDPSTHN